MIYGVLDIYQLVIIFIKKILKIMNWLFGKKKEEPKVAEKKKDTPSSE
jgi:hypothetical protein